MAGRCRPESRATLEYVSIAVRELQRRIRIRLVLGIIRLSGRAGAQRAVDHARLAVSGCGLSQAV